MTLKRTIFLLSALLLLSACGSRGLVKMVHVKGGTFMMGAGESQDGLAEQKEYPPHQVTLDDFEISACEITVGQFKQFVDETGYVTGVEGGGPYGDETRITWYSYVDSLGNASTKKDATVNWRHDYYGKPVGPDRYDLPVAHVDYSDALAFCKWLSQKEGCNYTLPTEAQWEYAARGGAKSKGYLYPGSDNINEVAWYFTTSEGHTHPVGQLKPNELGIYDMAGNVSEWILDRYFPSYREEQQTNPIMWIESSITVCARGSSCAMYELTSRVTSRRSFLPHVKGGGLGFRIVKNSAPYDTVYRYRSELPASR